jgi:hypothetical protein
MNDEVKLIANKRVCSFCNEEIWSKHQHDFVRCRCGACFLDGGNSYSRWGGDSINTSIWSDAPFEVIRQYVLRGGRGVNGDQPLTWVPIAKMSDLWLENCILYVQRLGGDQSDHYKYLEMEVKYREENNISIADD